MGPDKHSEAEQSGTEDAATRQRVREAAAQAHAALCALVDTAAGEMVGRRLDSLDPELVKLVWNPRLRAEDLAETVLQLVAQAVSKPHVFETGQTYCYACGTAECQHARPRTSSQVFTGYESTGRPRWDEFFNCLLALHDQRTDRLFAEKPEVLARVVGRTRLIADQLASFGRNALTYRIWGQVVAGYLNVGADRTAFTVQLVEDHRHCLHLQMIAHPLLLEALANAPDDQRSAFHRVYDAIAEARRQTLSLSGVWCRCPHRKKAFKETRDKAFAILRHLAHSVERKGRQHRRRTLHAEVRGAQQRPVHKAYDDVVAAAAEDIYLDRYKNSIIVSGRGGRIHAFSHGGRHITSLVLGKDDFEKRVARKRYVRCEREDIETFRAGALAGLVRSADDEDSSSSETT